MAGHSHAKNVMHRKAAQNNKRAKIITKISRAISVAVQLGGDPEANHKLKYALKLAQMESVPKDVIKRAIEKRQEKDDLEEIMYEGYANGGVAVLVETLTNNKTKTAAEIRAIFSKHNSALSEPNSVAFLFDRVAFIECKVEEKEYEEFFLHSMELDALDVFENATHFRVDDFHKAQDHMEKRWELTHAELRYIPKTLIELNNTDHFNKFISVLEDNESVQSIWHNLQT